MRIAHLISLVACLGIAISATAGDLRVTCAPGLNIFLDGEFVGVSIPKYDGKYLTGLSDGKHTIMVKKIGFTTKEISVIVGASPIQVVVGELLPNNVSNQPQPETTSRDVVGRPVGTIEVTSDPQICTVGIVGQEIVKQEPIMTIPGIPVGDYDIRFEISGVVLNTNVVVRADEISRIRADFPTNRVENTVDDSGDGESVSPSQKDGSQPKSGCIEYWVEVVRTSNPEVIEPIRSSLKEAGFPLYHQKLITIEDDGVLPLYKLRIGPINHKKDAKRITTQMKNGGYTAAWLVPVECQ